MSSDLGDAQQYLELQATTIQAQLLELINR